MCSGTLNDRQSWIAGLQEEIQAVVVQLMDAFAKGDAEAMAALYTSDCKVMPPGTDIVEGQQGTYSIPQP